MTELLASAVAKLEEFAYPEAKQLAEQCLAASPDDALAWGVLASSQLELDELDDALASAERWAALQPATASAHTLLSRIHNRRGQAEAARNSAGSAIALSPDHYLPHLELGRALASLGDSDAALGSLARASALLDAADPELAPVLGLEAVLRLQQGDRDEAEALLQRAQTLAPGIRQFAELLDSLGTRATAATLLQVVRRQASLLLFGHAIALAVGLIAAVLLSPDDVLGALLPRIFGAVALGLGIAVVIRSRLLLRAEDVDGSRGWEAARSHPGIGLTLALHALALLLPLLGLIAGLFFTVPLALLLAVLAIPAGTLAARALRDAGASDARESI